MFASVLLMRLPWRTLVFTLHLDVSRKKLFSLARRNKFNLAPDATRELQQNKSGYGEGQLASQPRAARQIALVDDPKTVNFRFGPMLKLEAAKGNDQRQPYFPVLQLARALLVLPPAAQGQAEMVRD